MKRYVYMLMAAITLTACSPINDEAAPQEEYLSASAATITEKKTVTFSEKVTTEASELISDTVSSEESIVSELCDTEITEAPIVTSDEPMLTETANDELAEYICYADSEHVKICGRTLFKDNVRYLGYSCSSVEFNFHGKYAEIELIPEPLSSEENEYSYYSVTVNSEDVFKGLLTEKTVFTAVDTDTAEDINIKITKLSEGCFGAVGVGYIKTIADGEIFPAEPAQKRIEFIGDSLTCGYGVNAANATERFSTSTEDGLAAYAAITAERLGMDYNIIGMNGIGVISRYTPRGEKKTEGFLMPELYRYTDGFRSNEIWDNNNFVPDICVIALGANDNSYTCGIKSREEEFSEGYIDFIKQVRQANPNAYIICASGIQKSNLYEVINASVDSYKTETGDVNICSFRFNSQKDSEGYGSDYHPSAVSQKRFADELYNVITEILPEYSE